METRPTSDKVREAIFAILGAAVVDTRVLDLFAGTGALGIEALSRGAAEAIFVERRPAACSVIRANLHHTRLDDLARVLCMTVERALSVLGEPCGLILLDPPYSYSHIPDIMDALGGARVIGNDSIVVFEHSPRFVVDERYGRLLLQRQKVYGDTAVSIFGTREGQGA
jgi:16S rRNA (guanine966-N2)-methyltransferase